MRIVVLDGEIANPGDLSWAGLESLGQLTVWPSTAKNEVVPRLAGADAAITNKVPIRREVIESCPHLRYIGLLSTGYNQIDLEAAAERGIPVCNVPEYSTAGVAQHTIALLLEITNQVGHHAAAVAAGRWQGSNWSFWDAPLSELYGKTLGIIGFGRIGRATGSIAKALGMRVLATGSRILPEGRAIAQYVPLEELLAASDVVALHCPLLPETREIINRSTIAKMRPGAILLNTSRGGLVAEQDLADALHSGHLAAAGLDVVSREPMRPDNPLQKAPHCYITPHIAWVAKETRARLLAEVEENLLAFQEGRRRNQVN